ncbi:MAG: hypothetical protein DRP42_05425 [Tenericutes bacterium]|nr:MAG: hypothetical protein DRP42_05425 [Mycoplasmatota bacterium]
MKQTRKEIKQKREELLRIIARIKANDERTLNNIARIYANKKKQSKEWKVRNRTLQNVRYHLLILVEQAKLNKREISKGDSKITIFTPKKEAEE